MYQLKHIRMYYTAVEWYNFFELTVAVIEKKNLKKILKNKIFGKNFGKINFEKKMGNKKVIKKIFEKKEF